MHDFESDIKAFLRRHHFESISPVAALIDMDGTLYDSMRGHTAAWFRLATEIGIEATRDEFYLYEGMTGAATINLLFKRAFGRDATPDEAAELYQRKTEYFRELPPVDVMPGAGSLLEQMQEMGMRRVLVTGSGQSSLINRLKTDFPGAFIPEMMVTSKSVTHGKPHPEPYIRAMQLAGVSPRKALTIENAPLGVKSSDSAGVFTIAVTTGPIPRQELVNAGAAVVFDSMQELADNFPQLMLLIFNTQAPRNVIF